jgi:hypothetical protein
MPQRKDFSSFVNSVLPYCSLVIARLCYDMIALMKRLLAAFPILLFLFAGCSSNDPAFQGKRFIDELYGIEMISSKYSVSTTYQSLDNKAIVLASTCDLKRKGAIPAVEFIALLLEKENGDWKVALGPNIYNPREALPLSLEERASSDDLWLLSEDLLKKLPQSCQEKYIKDTKSNDLA